MVPLARRVEPVAASLMYRGMVRLTENDGMLVPEQRSTHDAPPRVEQVNDVRSHHVAAGKHKVDIVVPQVIRHDIS